MPAKSMRAQLRRTGSARKVHWLRVPAALADLRSAVPCARSHQREQDTVTTDRTAVTCIGCLTFMDSERPY